MSCLPCLRHPRKEGCSSSQAPARAKALKRALRMCSEKRPVWSLHHWQAASQWSLEMWTLPTRTQARETQSREDIGRELTGKRRSSALSPQKARKPAAAAVSSAAGPMSRGRVMAAGFARTPMTTCARECICFHAGWILLARCIPGREWGRWLVGAALLASDRANVGLHKCRPMTLSDRDNGFHHHSQQRQLSCTVHVTAGPNAQLAAQTA